MEATKKPDKTVTKLVSILSKNVGRPLNERVSNFALGSCASKSALRLS
jgi:hypothetical protein